VVVGFSRLLSGNSLCRCLTSFERLRLPLSISGSLRGRSFGRSCFTTKRDFGHL
jgi:hypothetical protein